MRRAFAAILILAAGAGIYALTSGPGGRGERPLLRPAPLIPTPDMDTRVRYFYAKFTSGEQTDVAGQRIPTWYRLAQPALIALGQPAVDFLLSPGRYAEYRASPNILSNVLKLLPTLPRVAQQPRLQPFLLHWLDPNNCPPVSEGNDWVSFWRKPIFAMFTHFPDRRQIAACLDELDRDERKQDLRPMALIVLLQVGEVDAIKQRWKSLPQGLIHNLLVRIYELALADPSMARAFLDELRRSLDAPSTRERIYAAAALFRLAKAREKSALVKRLLAEYERAQKLGQEDFAWIALRVLAADTREERVLQLCLEHARGNTPTFSWTVANELLRKYWLHHPEVAELLRIRFKQLDPKESFDKVLILTLMKLGRSERDRMVAFLKTCILGDNRLWRKTAIEFVQVKRVVPKAAAWIIRLLQSSTDPDTRARYYGALVRMQAREVLPLARVDLTDASDPGLRSAAAGVLIAMGDKQGMALIGERLGDGDTKLLGDLFGTAQRVTGGGLPDALAAAILDALSDFAGEEDRLKALFILRARGRLDDIRLALVSAYRTEPSRRMARSIGAVIQELAHR